MRFSWRIIMILAVAALLILATVLIYGPVGKTAWATGFILIVAVLASIYQYKLDH